MQKGTPPNTALRNASIREYLWELHLFDVTNLLQGTANMHSTDGRTHFRCTTRCEINCTAALRATNKLLHSGTATVQKFQSPCTQRVISARIRIGCGPHLEGTSPMSTGLRTATSSGVKLVSTSASPSGSRFTAQYKQLQADCAGSCTHKRD